MPMPILTLTVFASNGEVERYNVFHVAMILRHDKDGKKNAKRKAPMSLGA